MKANIAHLEAPLAHAHVIDMRGDTSASHAEIEPFGQELSCRIDEEWCRVEALLQQ